MKRKNRAHSIASACIGITIGQFIVIALAEYYVQDEDLDFETAVCILDQIAGEKYEM